MSIRLKDTITDSIDKLDGQHSSYFAHTIKVGDTSYNSNSSIITLPSYTTNTGTVTNVSMTVPTGLTISGSGITTSGTLALTYTSGYSIPTTTKQTNWDTAYSWGNHANVGYAKSTDLSKYLPLSGGQMTGGISCPIEFDGNVTGLAASCVFYYDNSLTARGSIDNKRSLMGYGKNNTTSYWYNIISVRGDSPNYGMYIISSMNLNSQENLYWNRHIGSSGDWQGERVILDSHNWSSYINTSGGSFNGGTITENLVISKANPLCLGSFSNGDATIYSNTSGCWFRYYANGGSLLFETQAYNATTENNGSKNREMILFRNGATGLYHFCLNMPVSYSASSTTATPDSLFFCNGTARIAETLRIGAAGTGVEAATTRYICCQGKTGASYINWGYSDSAGNIGELTFNYFSSASSSNMVGIGFHSKNCIACYYDGRVNIPGTLQIGGESITFTT